MKRSLLALGMILSFTVSQAGISTLPQNTLVCAPQGGEDTAYLRVVTERAGKIVAALGLADSARFIKVRTMVADQYVNLNAIYADRDSALKQLKGRQPALDKSVFEAVKKDADTKVARLHGAYLKELATTLDQQQIDKVKDGMTYSVLEVTYKGYLDELPDLTDEQKAYILSALTEAREFAMDGGSSKEKHAWFGKYKGRINNYLSAQGYDMKKAGEEWQKRRAAK